MFGRVSDLFYPGTEWTRWSSIRLKFRWGAVQTISLNYDPSELRRGDGKGYEASRKTSFSLAAEPIAPTWVELARNDCRAIIEKKSGDVGTMI